MKKLALSIALLGIAFPVTAEIPTKPTKKTVKKVKAPARIDGFYLDLPSAYVMPAEVQLIFKEHIQGTTQLEGDYSKYCLEKQRLIDWALLRMEDKRQVVEAKWKDESLRYIAEVSAYKVSSMDELRSKRNEWKARYESDSKSEAAYQMYMMYDDTLDRLPKQKKYRQLLDAITSDIEMLKKWKSGEVQQAEVKKAKATTAPPPLPLLNLPADYKPAPAVTSTSRDPQNPD